MDLSYINRIVHNTYYINTKFDNSASLIKNEIYKVIELNRIKRMFGSTIEVKINMDLLICVPSFRSQNLFEQDHSLYRDLKSEAENGNLYIKYLGNKKIEFVCIKEC